MKVCTVVGTRPEIIKLSRVIPALDKATEHTLIHTGQNYSHELNGTFFEEMEIRKPNDNLNSAEHRTLRVNTAIETIAEAMVKLEDRMTALRPDALLILGDTNSCVAAAYVAKRKKVPVFHMEAGNRCFDERVPEEINRRIVDHISDINMPYSSVARENLLREGIPSDRIIKTGSPMNEVLNFYAPRIDASNVLSWMGLEKGKYFLVSCHREENVDSPEKFKAFIDFLNKLAERFHQRIIVSAHPRLSNKLGTWGPSNNEIEIYKPFGFFDYSRLQQDSRCVFSDSGTITEESSILGFPALNLRETHERLEGMEEASVIMTGMNFERIFESLPLAEKQHKGYWRTPEDYLPLNVSDKVVSITLSYTDYVNRTVWRKNV